LDYPLHIRFIELMDFAPSRKNFFVSCTVALMRLKEHGKFEEVSSLKGAGPARYYRLKGAKGTLGFICPYTEHFCESCNRLRISADGKMKPCLFSDFSVDLKRPLREGATDEEIKTLILKALKSKPEKRGVNRDKVEGEGMRRIGG
jgi:cyclic pyranopterin phosphate synthase